MRTFPKIRRRPVSQLRIAATGDSFFLCAVKTASPSRRALVSDPQTIFVLTSATVNGPKRTAAEQLNKRTRVLQLRLFLLLTYPILTVCILMKSSSCFAVSTWITGTHSPFSLTRQHGPRFAPYMAGVNICNSGKARPMPSASITGSPTSAPSMSGSILFIPPISQLTTATTFPLDVVFIKSSFGVMTPGDGLETAMLQSSGRGNVAFLPPIP